MRIFDDMNFIPSWWRQYFSHFAPHIRKILLHRWEIKFISSRRRVISSIRTLLNLHHTTCKFSTTSSARVCVRGRSLPTNRVQDTRITLASFCSWCPRNEEKIYRWFFYYGHFFYNKQTCWKTTRWPNTTCHLIVFIKNVLVCNRLSQRKATKITASVHFQQ